MEKIEIRCTDRYCSDANRTYSYVLSFGSFAPPPVDFYEIYENTPADCNESERGKEQKETQELQQKQTPATPAEKQNTP